MNHKCIDFKRIDDDLFCVDCKKLIDVPVKIEVGKCYQKFGTEDVYEATSSSVENGVEKFTLIGLKDRHVTFYRNLEPRDLVTNRQYNQIPEFFNKEVIKPFYVSKVGIYKTVIGDTALIKQIGDKDLCYGRLIGDTQNRKWYRTGKESCPPDTRNNSLIEFIEEVTLYS
jgi:hypothetical protein